MLKVQVQVQSSLLSGPLQVLDQVPGLCYTELKVPDISKANLVVSKKLENPHSDPC